MASSSEMETGEFEIGEKVLCPHVGMTYEAKVLKAELRDGAWTYFVHYNGWNKKYDEWVEGPVLIKLGGSTAVGDPVVRKTESVPAAPAAPKPAAPAAAAPPKAAAAAPPPKAAAAAAAPKAAAAAAPKVTSRSTPASSVDTAPANPAAHSGGQQGASKKRSHPVSGTSSGGAVPHAVPHVKDKQVSIVNNKKQAGETGAVVGGVQRKSSPCHLSLDVPPALKRLLLDDHAAVVEGGKLIPLPRSPTVSELLKRYVQESHNQRGSSVNEEEVAHGLRAYFDKSLEAVLLYRSEREHAAKALSGGRTPSSVFGAEHLCRLFMKLPYLLTATSATEEQVANVGVMVQDVMLWMSDNIGTLFLPKDKYIPHP